MSEYVVLLLVALATIAFAFKLFKRPSAQPIVAPRSKSKQAPPTAASAPTSSGSKCPPINIYFGSQSGTAEGYANDLLEQAKANGFNGKVIDLEEVDEDWEGDAFSVFVVATFGEGEPTDNAQKFCEWIRSRDRPDGLLANTNFAVFALGNRQYEHFCQVGKLIDERMQRLGAKRIIELAMGDDDGSLEDDFIDWKARFWPAVRSHFGLAAATMDGPAQEEFKSTVGCQFFAIPKPGDKQKAQDELFNIDLGDEVKVDEKKEDKPLPPAPLYVGGLLAFQRYSDPKHKADLINCTENRELRQDATAISTTRHLEFQLPKGCRLKYTTSFNLGVFPRNDFKLAAKLARRLGVDTRSIFKLEKKPGNRKLPLPMHTCSVQDALLWYLDFMQVTKSKTLKIMAMYANAEDRAKLLHWAGDGKEEFHTRSLHLLEVLNEVPSVTPPWEEFVEWCPKLQPRFYTIASSSRLHPDTIHLTVSLTVDELSADRQHIGVCSSFLCGLRPGKDQIVAFVRKSSFDLPKVANTPIVMVGPGTGVAPFRGFWQEIRTLREQAEKREAERLQREKDGAPESKAPVKEPYRVGEALLYFGCRHPDQDWLYRDEMEAYEKDGSIKAITAFSRHTEKKVYVQDQLVADKAKIWALIQQGAYFYVCGGTAMGRGVRAALTSIIENEGGKSASEAAAFIEQLQKAAPQQRYVQELWS